MSKYVVLDGSGAMYEHFRHVGNDDCSGAEHEGQVRNAVE